MVSFVWKDMRNIQKIGNKKNTRTSVISTARPIFSKVDE